jgi:hypothetical protein
MFLQNNVTFYVDPFLQVLNYKLNQYLKSSTENKVFFWAGTIRVILTVTRTIGAIRIHVSDQYFLNLREPGEDLQNAEEEAVEQWLT